MQRAVTAALFAEAIGTFFFFFVGMGAVVLNTYETNAGGSGTGLIGVALAHGLVLAIMVSAFGAVSGGHFNPAVTLGVWVAGKIEPMKAVLYVVAQLVGAVVAGVALRFVFPEAAWKPSSIGLPALGPDISAVTGIAVEAILTAILVTMVLLTAVDERAPKIGGFAIGIAVLVDILAGGPITGAAMNPARWFGPAIAAQNFTDFYVWIIGPLLGGAVAALLYRGLWTKEAMAQPA